MKVVIWNDPITGILCVIHPAYGDATRGATQKDADILESVIVKDVPPNVAARIIEDTDLPSHISTDRYFRDACEDTGAIIEVNMPKARGIHMSRIREVRNAELAKLDVPYTKALEAGDSLEQARIANEKQKLRDIPQTFDLTVDTTPETLKAAWPTELPARE